MVQSDFNFDAQIKLWLFKFEITFACVDIIFFVFIL